MFNLWKTWSVTEYRAFSFVWEMNFKRAFPFAHITPYHMQNLLSPWQILLGRKWSSAGGETPGVLSETSLRDAWRKTLRYVWQTALLLIYTSPLSSPLLPAHVIPFMCDFRVDDNLEYWKILEISAVLLTGSWICYFPSCNLGLAEQLWISSVLLRGAGHCASCWLKRDDALCWLALPEQKVPTYSSCPRNTRTNSEMLYLYAT